MSRSLSLADRAAVAGRIALAALGGYGLAALLTALLSLTLPLDRAEAVTASTLASFAVMALAVLYVFSARSLKAATIGLGLPLLGLGAALWLALSTGVGQAG
ncbi:iron transporter [Methylobacterium organophilum]|uniref:iron transporter n=1 Tax=Methylobacterium organophilum TaxID=410 RepID=UPI001F139473|nr:iron transporter [Methylobacterium organophilum]UMY17366.1 iron transporter [Methylobacterium organophilum]